MDHDKNRIVLSLLSIVNGSKQKPPFVSLCITVKRKVLGSLRCLFNKLKENNLQVRKELFYCCANKHELEKMPKRRIIECTVIQMIPQRVKRLFRIALHLWVEEEMKEGK